MTVAVVGSYGCGMTMRLDRVPDRGETVAGGVFSLGPGGKGSNQAVGLARLGIDVSLLTAVGDDAFGAAARDLWRTETVDASHVVTAAGATMVGVILVERDGENRIVIAPGALDELTPAHVDGFADVIAAADLMMVCNEVPAEVVVAALRVARARGTATLYNPAPARALPPDAWDLVDYVTPNLGEARVLAELTDGEPVDAPRLVRALRDRLRGTIALTAGSDGVYLDDPATDGPVHIDAVDPPEIVDTTGAGDTFNAAFAAALCRGEGPEAAARYAAAAGAYAVGRPEVIPGLPTATELDEFIRRHRDHRTTDTQRRKSR